MSGPGAWPPPQSSASQWGPPQWAPPAPPSELPAGPPSPYPQHPVAYPQFWRSAGVAVWRPVVVLLLGAVAFFGIATVVTIVALVVEAPTHPGGLEGLLTDLTLGRVTPGIVLANSIAIALVLPACFAIAALVRQRPGYLSSVTGRFRWGFFWRAIGVAGAFMAIYVGASILIEGVAAQELQVHPYTWWLLIGLMLVTPFQAAGEEYLVRGLLFRVIGSWCSAPLAALIVGGLLNSLVFMLMHGAGDMWLNLIYFGLGLMLSYLTWRTGGLEAAAAIHIANNMFGMAILAFQDVGGAFDRGAGAGGPAVLWQLLTLGAAVAVIELIARRRRLVRLGAGPAGYSGRPR